MFPFDSGSQLVKTDIDYLVSYPVMLIDMSIGQRFSINMVSDITLISVVCPYEGAEIVIGFVQDSTGGRLVNGWMFTDEFGVLSSIDSSIVKPKNQDYTNLGLSLSAGITDFIKITYINRKFNITKVDNF